MVKSVVIPNETAVSLSSNWKKMLEAGAVKTGDSKYRTMVGIKGTGKGLTAAATEVVAIDCEMVTVRTKTGDEQAALARVSIVDDNNNVLIDSYVRPTQYIIDYKTEVSGVKPGHLRNAPELAEVKPKVEEILRNKIVVGHAVWNDFEVLGIEIPQELIRDTSRCPLLRLPESNSKTVSLKRLCEHWLELTIQEGEHDSVVDAKATMRLYKLKRADWEKFLKKPKHVQQQIVEALKEGKPINLGSKSGVLQPGVLKAKSSDDVVTFSDEEEEAKDNTEVVVKQEVPEAFRRAAVGGGDDEFGSGRDGNRRDNNGNNSRHSSGGFKPRQQQGNDRFGGNNNQSSFNRDNKFGDRKFGDRKFGDRKFGDRNSQQQSYDEDRPFKFARSKPAGSVDESAGKMTRAERAKLGKGTGATANGHKGSKPGAPGAKGGFRGKH